MPRLSTLALIITLLAAGWAPLGASTLTTLMAAPPTVRPIPPLTVPGGTAYLFVINGSFPGGGLRYTARQANGAPLPSWMRLDGSTGSFYFEAPVSAQGQLYHLKVDATDLLGRSHTATFYLTVDTYTPDCRIDANTDRLAKVLDCQSGTVQLRGHCSTGEYKWTGPNGFHSSEPEPTVTEPGTYFLRSTTQQGQSCQRISMVEVLPPVMDCQVTDARNQLPDVKIIADRTEGSEYLSVQLDGTNSTDSDGRVIGYRWSWGEGVATGPRPQVTFAEGEHELVLTATDETGARSTDRIDITVDARPQHEAYWLEAECAQVGGNWATVESQSASGGSYLNPLLSSHGVAPAAAPENYVRFQLKDAREESFRMFVRISAADNSKDSYWVRVNGGTWYAWKSGIHKGTGFHWNDFPFAIKLAGGDNTVDIAYREKSTLLDKIYLTVGGEKPEGSGDKALNCVQNTPPLAVALASERTGTAPLAVMLDGSQSTDEDGRIVSYAWSWDGGTAMGENARISLPAGDHRITLTVTDDGGATHEDMTVVRVSAPNLPPVAVAATGKTFGTGPLTLRLNAAGSTDEDGNIVSYRWKWNGGTADGINPTVTLPVGDYRIELTVTDNDGASDSDVAYVEVEAPASGGTPTQEYWLEAECAQLGSDWSTGSSSAAGNGKYIVVTDGNAYSAPRGDGPQHLARFTISSAVTGTYDLFARVSAPTNLDDSYWVRINEGKWVKWYRGFRQGEGFAWNDFPEPLYLKAGVNTIDFALREDGAQLDKIYLTTTGQKPSGSGQEGSNCSAGDSGYELECATIGSEWKRRQDASASNGDYLVFTGGRQMATPTIDERGDRIQLSVTAPITETYYLHMRLDAPDPARNSLWVRVDDGGWIKFWEEIGGDQLLTDGFDWRVVNHDGKLLSFELTAGEHTIHIANREPGTKLDKVVLSTEAASPAGMGAAANNCGGGTRAMAFGAQQWVTTSPSTDDTEDVAEAFEISVSPNPTFGNFSLQLSSDYRGTVDAVLSDVTGRRLRSYRIDKSERQLTTSIDIANLPAGVYFLRVNEGSNYRVKQIVRR